VDACRRVASTSAYPKICFSAARSYTNGSSEGRAVRQTLDRQSPPKTRGPSRSSGSFRSRRFVLAISNENEAIVLRISCHLSVAFGVLQQLVSKPGCGKAKTAKSRRSFAFSSELAEQARIGTARLTDRSSTSQVPGCCSCEGATEAPYSYDAV